jgi:hypothetical protein
MTLSESTKHIIIVIIVSVVINMLFIHFTKENATSEAPKCTDDGKICRIHADCCGGTGFCDGSTRPKTCKSN